MKALRENYLTAKILYGIYTIYAPLNIKVSHQDWGLHGGRAYAHARSKKAALDTHQLLTQINETIRKLYRNEGRGAVNFVSFKIKTKVMLKIPNLVS